MAKRKGSKADQRVQKVRWMIGGFFAVVIALVALYGLLYSTGATEGEFVEGTHFEVIETDHRRRAGDAVEVLEFFSYGCVHCKNFDPLIEEWHAEQDPARVEFRRQPVAFSPIWQLLGRTYITLESMDALDANHDRIFRAVHDQGKQFLSAEMMAEFVDGNGVSSEDFLRTFNSPAVRTQAARMEQLTAEYQVRSVPTIVVAGRYQINMGIGRKVALRVVDHLVTEVLNETSP